MIDRLMTFLDSVDGGAWPFLVRGLICQVNSDNERDLSGMFGSYVLRGSKHPCQKGGSKPS